MSAETDAYKEFVDGLAQYRGSASYILQAFSASQWNHPSCQLLNQLPDEVREAIASAIKKTAEAAMHDVLVYMTDREYSVTRNGVTLPSRPFEAAIYDDFIARIDGIPWPDFDSNNQE